MNEFHNPALVEIAGVQFEPADGERWGLLRTNPRHPRVIVTHPDRPPLSIRVVTRDHVEVGEINAAMGQGESYGTGTALEALQAVEKWRARRDSNSRPPGS